MTGDIESAGDISVEGSVEGNITCRTLTLRGEPTITGDVHAEAVHVCGRFTGTLRAKKVVLTKAARMTGDIYYERLEIKEGAKFEGGAYPLLPDTKLLTLPGGVAVCRGRGSIVSHST